MTAFSVAPVPSVHRPPTCRPMLRPSGSTPAPAPQFQATSYGQRPRPWSSTAHEPAGTSWRTPSVVIVPDAGRATSLTVYWNRRVDHGTTTARQSWCAGRVTVMSNEASGIAACSRQTPPSPVGVTVIARSFACAIAMPPPSEPGSTMSREGMTVAPRPHERSEARSNTHTSCTAA